LKLNAAEINCFGSVRWIRKIKCSRNKLFWKYEMN